MQKTLPDNRSRISTLPPPPPLRQSLGCLSWTACFRLPPSSRSTSGCSALWCHPPALGPQLPGQDPQAWTRQTQTTLLNSSHPVSEHHSGLERNCGHNVWLTTSKCTHQNGKNLMDVAGHLVTSPYLIDGLQRVPCASTTSRRPKNLFWICESYLKIQNWWNMKKKLEYHLQVPSLLFSSQLPPLVLLHALLSNLVFNIASSLLLSASSSSTRQSLEQNWYFLQCFLLIWVQLGLLTS